MQTHTENLEAIISILRAEKEALEKKLAQWQAALTKIASLTQSTSLLWWQTEARNALSGGTEELTKLLAAARQQGFDEGSKITSEIERPIAFNAGKQAGRDELQEEIASLKAQLAEAQKVPDGWQFVPKDISNEVKFRDYVRVILKLSFGETRQAWKAILSAAPAYKKED